jgi:hypothetical protein
MKKIRLTEGELVKLIKNIINETETYSPGTGINTVTSKDGKSVKYMDAFDISVTNDGKIKINNKLYIVYGELPTKPKFGDLIGTLVPYQSVSNQQQFVESITHNKDNNHLTINIKNRPSLKLNSGDITNIVQGKIFDKDKFKIVKDK